MKAGASTKLAILRILRYHRLSTQQHRGGLGDSEMEIATLLKRKRYGPFVTGAF